jgi:hypothetical protein
MLRRTCQPLLMLLPCLLMVAAPAGAINIRVDYTYDMPAHGGSNFFGGNVQAKAALEAAAGFFSSILNDSFSEITVPQPFTISGSNYTWQWSQQFRHPSSTQVITLQHTAPGTTIAANEYVVFAGAQNLAGNTLGIGGPGGFGWSHGGSYHPAYEGQINSITTTFVNQVEKRGQSSGFARWGGTISFDTAPPAPWHFSHTIAPAGNVVDFYSVAIHELAHALGFGERDDDPANITPWESWVSGSSFYGANATAKYGGPVPLSTQEPDPSRQLTHWAPSTNSFVYGSSILQQAAMDPNLTNGTRKHFTELDAAAMIDIGWSVIPLPGVHGDYNNNGRVDAADYVVWRKRLGQNVTIPNDATPGSVTTSDYTVWRNNFGKTPSGGAGSAALAVAAPEPTSAALALVAILVACAPRRPRPH